MCSFNNRAGGHILLGVNDKKEVIGVSLDKVDKLIKEFTTITVPGQGLSTDLPTGRYPLTTDFVKHDIKSFFFLFVKVNHYVIDFFVSKLLNTPLELFVLGIAWSKVLA